MIPETLQPFAKQKVRSPTDFPASYHFYSYMCSHPPITQYFSWVFYYLIKIQDYLTAFTPLIIDAQRNGRLNSRFNPIYATFSGALHFSSFDVLLQLRNGSIDTTIITIFIVFAILLLFSLLYFYFFIHQDLKAMKVMSHFRSLIYFPFQLLAMYPCVTCLAQMLGGRIDNIIAIDYFNFIILIIGIIVMIIYTLWIKQIYYSTPIINDSWIPSPLIPNGQLNYIQILHYVVFFFTFAISGEYSSIFFTIFSIILHTCQIYWASRKLCIYKSDNSILIGLSVHIIIFSILSTVSTYNEWLYNNFIFFFWSSFAIYIIIMVIVYRIFSNEKVISHFDLLSKCQYEIFANSFNFNQINELNEKFLETMKMEYLIAYIYFKLMVGDIDQQVSDYIIALSQSKHGWFKDYIVFELYKYYCSISYSVFDIPKIQELKDSLAKYTDENHKFWKMMIIGQTMNALNSCHENSILMKKNIRDFYFYYTFFPHHTTITNLRHDFPYLMQTLEKGMTLKDRFNARGKNFIIVDTFQKNPSTASSSDCTGDELDQIQIKKVYSNLNKLASKPVPILFIIFYVCSLLCVLIAIVFLCIPFTKLNQHVRLLNYLPETVSRTVHVGTEWGKFDTLINNLIMNHQGIMKIHPCEYLLKEFGSKQLEPPGVECMSIYKLAQNMTVIADTIAGNISLITSSINKIESKSYYESMIYHWNYPSIHVFSSSHPMNEVQADPMTIITLFMSLIYLANGNHTTFYEEFKLERANSFLISSWGLFETFIGTMNSANQHINQLKNANDINLPFSSIAIKGIIIPCFAIVICCLFISSFYYITLLMNKHFRPKTHPNNEINCQYSQTTDPFKINKSTFALVAILIISYGIYMLQMIYFWGLNQNAYIRLLKYCNLIISLGNYSICAAKILSGYSLREIYFSPVIYPDLNANLGRTQRLIESFIFQLGNSDTISSLYTEFCHDFDYGSMHDIVRCWPITLGLNYFYYITSIYQTHGKDFFFVIEHYYIAHLIPMCQQLSNTLLYLISETSNFIALYVLIEVIVASFIGVFLILFLVRVFLTLSDYFHQLEALLINLSLIYIVKNKCLVEFLIELPEDRKEDDSNEGILHILNKSNEALLVISRDLYILACSKSLLTIFGYKIEQLVGQYIEILIPKSSNDTEKNDIKFYQQLKVLEKRHNLTPIITRNIVGYCNDRSSIHLKANIMKIFYNRKHYFIIEFISMSDELNFEDLIISHNELYTEISRSALPLTLFNNQLSRFPETKTFTQSVLVYVGYDIELDQSKYSDFEKEKKLHEFTLPYFGGLDDSILIDCSCSYCIILFVNNHQDDRHINNALTFISGYSQTNPYDTIGMMINSGNSRITLYPPPENNENNRLKYHVSGNSRKISFDDSERMNHRFEESETSLDPVNGEQINNPLSPVPKMAIEAQNAALNKLPKLMKYFQGKHLLVSDDLLDFFAETPFEPIENDLGYNISLVSIEFEELIEFSSYDLE
ncbi:hypothetical protein TRFO_40751 [Tritrichomonas foetus]|uniref:PAS domain-containing protein n=1 Tax=Tritrichomonas foetus TaxID=1144522 RepID=A0A1J4J2E1_9EUKA|nr:hypothetical protein TRFO_40751 [Tritrichomonas foetus]|eukprot:OHS92913.1 hypothetical protein TRFO_40751 [Tritrichomonas foetus]